MKRRIRFSFFFISGCCFTVSLREPWESDNLRTQVLDSQLPHGLDQESVAHS